MPSVSDFGEWREQRYPLVLSCPSCECQAFTVYAAGYYKCLDCGLRVYPPKEKDQEIVDINI